MLLFIEYIMHITDYNQSYILNYSVLKLKKILQV